MPPDPERLFQRCCELLRVGDASANALLPELGRFSAFAPGWTQLGQVLLQTKQPQAALIAFSRAVAAAPDMVTARLGRAAALLALGRADDAAAEYVQAETRAPASADIPHRRGHCLRQAGLLEAAAQAFQRAVSLDPGLSQAWFALGLVRQDLHDPSGAAAAYRGALAARPDFHEAALNLGVACQDTGHLDAALDAYGVALRCCPEAFGRIAQALAAGPVGFLWLDPENLRRSLLHRA